MGCRPTPQESEDEDEVLASMDDGTRYVYEATLRGGHRTKLADNSACVLLFPALPCAVLCPRTLSLPRTARTDLAKKLRSKFHSSAVPSAQGRRLRPSFQEYRSRAHVEWNGDTSVGQEIEEADLTRKADRRLGTTVFLLTLGAVATLVDYSVEVLSGQMLRGRVALAQNTDLSYSTRFGLWVFYTVAVALVSLLVTHYVSPAAKGSGIPVRTGQCPGGGLPPARRFVNPPAWRAPHSN
jgi:hypothetical protein